MLFWASLGFVKAMSIDEIAQIKPKRVEKVFEPTRPFVAILACDFGQASIDQDNIEDIGAAEIVRVELYYSSYKESEGFNQNALNISRLKQLRKLLPKAFENHLTQWNLMMQVEPDKEQAKTLFHGFFVHYRPEPTKAFTEKELLYLDNMLSGRLAKKELGSSYSVESYMEAAVMTEKVKLGAYGSVDYCSKKGGAAFGEVPEFPGGCEGLKGYMTRSYKGHVLKSKRAAGAYLSFQLDSDGKCYDLFISDDSHVEDGTGLKNAIESMPAWRMPEGADDSTFSVDMEFSIFSFRKEIKLTFIGIAIRKTIKAGRGYLATPSAYRPFYGVDSTILNFFKRNKGLERAAVVCDVTGSMSPYIGQIMLWHRLNFETSKDKIQYYCFFNDGNNRPDHTKVVGNVGGIHFAKPSTFEGLKKAAYKAMRAGCGGDAPENNFEAVIKTIEKYPDCQDIVMLADNWATPRDLRLLGQINRPIKIIVCGAYGGYINTAYLDAARRNGGSIHTIESDIENLKAVNEGETITIDGFDYQLKDGKFVRS